MASRCCSSRTIWGVARYLSDRIAVMKDGKIVEFGATEAVFRSPQHPYTRRLVLRDA